jgi:hypothetical protein
VVLGFVAGEARHIRRGRARIVVDMLLWGSSARRWWWRDDIHWLGDGGGGDLIVTGALAYDWRIMSCGCASRSFFRGCHLLILVLVADVELLLQLVEETGVLCTMAVLLSCGPGSAMILDVRHIHWSPTTTDRTSTKSVV